MSQAFHYNIMARAIQLAERGLYTTMPNPRVGCVLVKAGQIVGEGWHIKAGEGHAEVNALAVAGAKAKGATAYVTLEPCCHQGKTPPCCDALIAAGVSSVFIGMQDPNPQVAGQGIKRLRDAGVSVSQGLLEDRVALLNPGFIRRMQRGMPYVRAKLAMSLDGRTAMASGESQWITGSSARSDVQRLRAQSCAIVTGIGSILNDNSALTVRANELSVSNATAAAEKQPLRVVLDSTLSIEPDAKLLHGPGLSVVVAAVAKPAKEELLLALPNVQVWYLPGVDGRVDLTQLMRRLAEQASCNEVLIEAGSVLAGAMLQAGLIDEMIIYMAPKLLGSRARPLFELPIDSMAEQQPLAIKDIRAVGDDMRITAVPLVD